MKILFVHNDYGKYSGEEAVVDQLSSQFQRHGHEIAFYRPGSERYRSSLSGQMRGFLNGIYSFSGIRGLRRALAQERPDVVNVHNLYPFISPAALKECRRAGVPVVMTVHNYRLMCPTGLFLRNGAPCELCLQRGNEWSCVRYNCEHSFPKSLGYALRNLVARRREYYQTYVDAFVCLTAFQKEKLVEAGFDAEKIEVIPNGIEVRGALDLSRERGAYVGYAGRLSEEKGCDLLLEVARRHPEIPFHFAGEQRVELGSLPKNVHFCGHLSKTELEEFIKKARFLVIPSRCYEGFPMAILEAARQGRMVLGPAHGAFPGIIGSNESAIGKLFEPGRVESLEAHILELWNHPEESVQLGGKAYEKALREYDNELVLKKWESLFMRKTNAG